MRLKNECFIHSLKVLQNNQTLLLELLNLCIYNFCTYKTTNTEINKGKTTSKDT